MDHDAHRTSYQDVRTAPVETPTAEDLDRLRELLFGEELRDLAELRQRLDELGITADNLAEKLPAAVVLRSRRDKQLARALAPTIEDGLQEAVQRNPQKITDAIFPVLGPAIRKAIAETMASLVQTINRGIENSISPRGIRWRFEAWRTGVPYGQIVIKHALIYRVEQIFLIHSETGILLAHETADGVETPDADVVYSMLAAIKDFVHDSFNANAAHGMRRVSVADTVIFAQQGPHAIVGAVVRGHAPESLNVRLMNILERVHLQFGDELEKFDGDTAPFEHANALLQGGLETELATNKAGKSRSASRLVWGIAGLVVLALAFLYVRSVIRWNAAVGALQDTPGIVIVDTDRGWRSSSLSGLLDPDAARPNVILTSRGFDTTRIVSQWERYISADSAIVQNRLDRLLGLSPTVTWEIRDDTALASGAALPGWLANAALNRSIPGVSVLDVTNVALRVPDSLAQLRANLQQRRIEFDTGSGAIPFRNISQIDSVAPIIRSALAHADRYGLTTNIELVGRSDPEGTTDTNRVISQRRAEAVAAALRTRGIQAPMSTVGIGTSDPITTNAGAENQANRSVSFSLSFSLINSAESMRR